MREPYDESRNAIWQTRGNEPTARENALGDALEKIFAEEVYDLPGIVARLSELGVAPPDGEAWSEEAFRAEVAQLGRKEFG